ncbi:MAG: glutamine-hydrolyzing carbamoyl-phosphate synthase small subunit [Gammaproteobacteria bacterium]|uniref:Carbamoyl phosphate synthase small chain n=1 Tax=SAR86 cluster bacterium TaxID=2030880 RepID=A0A520MSN8_9GAMM|nr:carbamoyl-phosphate synthase small subunit [Gammaproteobacteria bacterium]RZO24228.1 MAG: carbamoyl-phosphate synthase small subunit [SAR86 cluster bacterium]|tara:strand:+ start:1648 stop:2739 length:1092 start_codon:yes stop_codon:yes gene_type:complete
MKFGAKLLLENGISFEGFGFGFKKIGVGEVVFNTSITGYQEILTDPSYDGQIITFTYPHIGNTGINFEDNESKNIAARGMIVKNFCDFPSSHRSKMSLEDFLVEQKTICISDIDTRHLTKILRDEGCKIGAIYPTQLFTDEEALSEINKFGSMDGKNFTENVAVSKQYNFGDPGTNKRYKIVAVDFGIKENILRIMKSLGGDIVVVPPSTSAEVIKALNPDGIFLSNGPGDPSVLQDAVKEVKKMMNLGLPIFGICLGHQIMSLAYGLEIEKMPFGHHGANHPVHDLKNNTVFITSQNHNFAVAKVADRDDINVTHKSLFDGSIQGIEHTSKPFYSIQCHPEASPGPKEFEVLFKRFFEDMNA